MILNHLDLPVTDVPALAAFLAAHFDLQPVTRLDSPAIAVLADDEGFTLVLQRATEPLPENLHIGFYVATVDEVVARRERLLAAGVAASELQRNARGVHLYVRAPAGLLVEVTCRAR